MNVSFFSDLLSSISERGRGLIGLSRGDERARANLVINGIVLGADDELVEYFRKRGTS